MSTSPDTPRDFLDDLLIQHAVYGLDSNEQNEMDELIRQLQPSDDDRFESTVAALDSGFAILEDEDNSSDLPENLRSKILDDAGPFVMSGMDAAMQVESEASASPTPAAQPASKRASSGWSVREKWMSLVTVASLMFAVASLSGLFNAPEKPVAGLPGQNPPPPTLTLAQQYEAFNPADVQKVSWSNPTNDSASKLASGEVKWSDSEQKGFMLFDGMEINDPSKKQYQLWIFDTARSDKRPVDGGVFDIDSTGSVIVPIDAKLSITQAKQFAVTIEVPGGVVVSERERLPLLAAIELLP